MNPYAITRAVRRAPEGSTLDLALISGEHLSGTVTAPDDHALQVTVGAKTWHVPATSVVAVGIPA